jgi:hypothetical protein
LVLVVLSGGSTGPSYLWGWLVLAVLSGGSRKAILPAGLFCNTGTFFHSLLTFFEFAANIPQFPTNLPQFAANFRGVQTSPPTEKRYILPPPEYSFAPLPHGRGGGNMG